MNPKQFIPGAALSLACLATLYYFTDATTDKRPAAATVHAALPVTAGTPTQDRDGATPDLGPSSGPTTNMANPLERAADLRTVYERYKNSKDAIARNTAYRAWSACFPTFIAPQGQSTPIENILGALPPHDSNNAERIEAYRSLLGRCKNFSDMSREEILRETQQQKNAWISGASHAPGERAAQYLTDGNTQQALRAARAIIASKDPYAIASLREFVNQYFTAHNDAQPELPIERPDLRALAFSVAACQMGLECGPASLTALQLCANSGMCAGDVVDRYLQSMPSQADRDALRKESRRVQEAIRSGDSQTLGL